MKNKTHTILLLLAFCGASAVSSDVMAQDYLEPSDRFTVNDKDGKYQDKYGNERILSLFPEEWSIGYLVSPSFSRQYGIFLIWDDDGPMLVYNRFNSNYSVSRRERSKREKNVKVFSDTVRISKDEAERLTVIITDAIDKAVEPDGLNIIFDGTTYHFMLPDKMAKTCSPGENTGCYKLVEVFENLKKLFGDEPFLELS